MKIYYVSSLSKSNGTFELHKQGCQFLPDFLSRKFLGHFNSLKEAVNESKILIPTAIGCAICLKESNK